jgi:ATP-binding cassette subfamily B protein
MITLAVILLFIQANADLSLPDYMADMVNYGIQQGGVKDAMPRAIRQSEMDHVQLLLTQEERDLVTKNYSLIDRSSPEYAQYVKIYPELANQPVYVLVNDDRLSSNNSPGDGQALLAVYNIEQVQDDPSKPPQWRFAGLDLSKLSPDRPVYDINKLPPSNE